MPSTSKTQQRLMGMSYAYKKGELDTTDMPEDLVSKVKELADSMTLKELKDFAKTKHEGLPEVVENKNNYILSFNDFLNEKQK